MAYSFYFNDDTAINIDEYVEWVDKNVDFNDESSILSSAFKIHQLSNNKSLLDKIIISTLKDFGGGIQQANVYTDATFILAMPSEKPFFVRANVWKTPQLRNGSPDWENQHYSYLFPHDHNFDFMTVGYHGSGYRTEIYEYDYDKIAGLPGESISLKFLEDTRLEKGKVIFFRKSKDLHIQYPPETLSISLNLMPRNDGKSMRQQYEFDLKTKKIANYISGDISLRCTLIEMASELANDNALDVLQEISRNHICQRTRKTAFSGLLKSTKTDKNVIYKDIENDNSVLVRSILNSIES
jgi:hypothetical protein